MFKNKLRKELEKNGKRAISVRDGPDLWPGTIQANGDMFALVSVKISNSPEIFFNVPYSKAEYDLTYRGYVGTT